MEIQFKDKDYIFDFKDCSNEKVFFLNTFDLAFDVIKNSYKESDKVSISIKEKINEILRYGRKNKLLRITGDIIFIRKDYLEILFENLQTYLMIILKDDKELSEKLRMQYLFLENFLRNFLQACLSSYNESNLL